MSQVKAAPGNDRLGAVPQVSEHEAAGRLTMTVPADPGAISVVVNRVARELEQRKGTGTVESIFTWFVRSQRGNGQLK